MRQESATSPISLEEKNKRLQIEKLMFEDTKKQLKELLVELTRKNTELNQVLEDLQSEKDKLAQARAKDEAMLASIGDGLVATDSQGAIVLVNNAFEKITGWSESDARGKKLADILPLLDEKDAIVPEAERLTTKALRQKTTTTTTTTTTLKYKKKDGTIFPVAITVSPIILNGEVKGTVEIFRDITQEKLVDRAKTEFVSLASHQLRTPLSSVNWYAEMLLAGDAGKINEEQKKYLEEIYTGNQRMVELVNVLLNVSRLELGTFAVNPKPTDVLELVRSVMDEQKLAIDQKELKLKPTLPDKLPIIQADTKLLRMVFTNIFSNSVKYTPKGGTIELAVSLAKKGEPVDSKKADEDSIAIKIKDTGYGIPKDQQDKVFTKLFRADNVREKDTEGTGLGLYIVKSIVEHSGGKIWFESEENKGTTFFIVLPLKGMEKKDGITELG